MGHSKVFSLHIGWTFYNRRSSWLVEGIISKVVLSETISIVSFYSLLLPPSSSSSSRDSKVVALELGRFPSRKLIPSSSRRPVSHAKLSAADAHGPFHRRAFCTEDWRRVLKQTVTMKVLFNLQDILIWQPSIIIPFNLQQNGQ